MCWGWVEVDESPACLPADGSGLELDRILGLHAFIRFFTMWGSTVHNGPILPYQKLLGDFF